MEGENKDKKGMPDEDPKDKKDQQKSDDDFLPTPVEQERPISFGNDDDDFLLTTPVQEDPEARYAGMTDSEFLDFCKRRMSDKDFDLDVLMGEEIHEMGEEGIRRGGGLFGKIMDLRENQEKLNSERGIVEAKENPAENKEKTEPKPKSGVKENLDAQPLKSEKTDQQGDQAAREELARLGVDVKSSSAQKAADSGESVPPKTKVVETLSAEKLTGQELTDAKKRIRNISSASQPKTSADVIDMEQKPKPEAFNNPSSEIKPPLIENAPTPKVKEKSFSEMTHEELRKHFGLPSTEENKQKMRQQSYEKLKRISVDLDKKAGIKKSEEQLRKEDAELRSFTEKFGLEPSPIIKAESPTPAPEVKERNYKDMTDKQLNDFESGADFKSLIKERDEARVLRRKATRENNLEEKQRLEQRLEDLDQQIDSVYNEFARRDEIKQGNKGKAAENKEKTESKPIITPPARGGKESLAAASVLEKPKAGSEQESSETAKAFAGETKIDKKSEKTPIALLNDLLEKRKDIETALLQEGLSAEDKTNFIEEKRRLSKDIIKQGYAILGKDAATQESKLEADKERLFGETLKASNNQRMQEIMSMDRDAYVKLLMERHFKDGIKNASVPNSIFLEDRYNKSIREKSGLTLRQQQELNINREISLGSVMNSINLTKEDVAILTGMGYDASKISGKGWWPSKFGGSKKIMVGDVVLANNMDELNKKLIAGKQQYIIDAVTSEITESAKSDYDRDRKKYELKKQELMDGEITDAVLQREITEIKKLIIAEQEKSRAIEAQKTIEEANKRIETANKIPDAERLRLLGVLRNKWSDARKIDAAFESVEEKKKDKKKKITPIKTESGEVLNPERDVEKMQEIKKALSDEIVALAEQLTGRNLKQEAAKAAESKPEEMREKIFRMYLTKEIGGLKGGEGLYAEQIRGIEVRSGRKVGVKKSKKAKDLSDNPPELYNDKPTVEFKPKLSKQEKIELSQKLEEFGLLYLTMLNEPGSAEKTKELFDKSDALINLIKGYGYSIDMDGLIDNAVKLVERKKPQPTGNKKKHVVRNQKRNSGKGRGKK